MSLINLTHQFIFIHIPKTAGKSIERVCSQINDTRRVSRHSNLEMIIKKYPLASKFWSFSCVRDPWDRQYSLYLYMLTQVRKKRQIEKIKELEKGFENFLTSELIQQDHAKEWFNHLHTNQIDWIQSTEKNCNFYIKFENIQQDWQIVASRLNLSTTLPVINQTHKQKTYKNMYNQVTKKIIEKRFQRDIDTFKYTF